MRRAALAALAAALLGAARQPDGEERRGPAPARPVAGMACFVATSAVVLSAAPDDPHTLVVVMGFPDRARWTLRRDGTSDRRIEYRFGEHAFALEHDARDSAALPQEELDGYLRRQALRQAAFVWPEGAPWEGTGEQRKARILALAGDPPEAAIGQLAAVLDPAGRPRAIEACDAAGRVEETLEILAWSSAEGREWPARLRLSAGGEQIWEETVLAVSIETRKDSFYVPGDQQQVLRRYAELERVRLPRVAALRLALAEGTDWPAARARVDAARGEHELALAKAGHRLDPRTWIVLAEDTLAPLAVELRLLSVPPALPQGFQERPERDALRLTLGGDSAPLAADRDRLLAARGGRSAEGWTAAVGAGEVLLDCVLAP